MSNLRRVGIVLLIVAVVVIVMSSFKGSDILDRAIILGIGIDSTDDGGISLTAEIVSPGNGSEQVGTFSKILTAKGRTVAEAIQNVAQLSGKEASLGQCVLLILGQEYYQNVNFTDLASYFINHHSFKESTVTCCSEGKAEDLFNKGDALSQSVSMSIAAMLLDEAEKIAVPTNNLLKFCRSQNELHCTGYLNKVKFVPSENKDSQDPDKIQGFFTYREMVVFRKNVYVCTLSDEEVKGMSLFNKKVTGDVFVSDADSFTRTVQVSDKSVDFKPTKNNGIEITITLSVRLGRTDSEEVSGSLSAKKEKEIDPKVLEDVQQQATELAKLYLAKQAELDFDLLNFHELFRQQDGSTDSLASRPTADFPVKLTVKVEEN